MSLFSLMFSFQGRIGRLQWWGGGLVQLIVGGGLFAAITSFLTKDGHAVPPQDLMRDAGALLAVCGIGALVMLWIGLALNVKRLHDRGKSGVWLFINLVPIVGPIWLAVELAFFAGDDVTNSFGPPGGSSASSGRSWRDDSGDGFDADAVIARYKDHPIPVTPMPAPSARFANRAELPRTQTGFGRRGLTT